MPTPEEWHMMDAQAEIKRLRAALKAIADFYDGERGNDNEQAKMAREALKD